MEHFLNDLDKMADFLIINKDEFLQSYSYLTEGEYNATMEALKENPTEVLSDLMRDAENLHIENVNNRDTDWEVTGEQLKSSIEIYAMANLSNSEYEEYAELCNSEGC